MRYKLSIKILFWFSLFIAAIVIANLTSIYQLQKMDEPLKEKLTKDIQNIKESERLDHLAQLIRYYDEVLTQSARNYAFTGNLKWKERYQDIEPKLDKAIKEAVSGGSKEDKQFFKAVNQANEVLVSLEHQALDLVDQGNQDKAVLILESEKYQTNKKQYHSGFSKYLQRRMAEHERAMTFSSKDLEETINILDQITKQNYYFFVGSSVFILLISLLFGLFLRFNISKPLTRLVNLIKASGKKGERKDLIGNNSDLMERKDEIGELATTYNQMWQDLEKTTVSKEKLKKSQLRFKALFESSKDAENKLKERAKEFGCLSNLASIVEEPDISLEGILAKTVKIIPPALRYSSSACARLKYKDREYQTDNFKKTTCNIGAEIYLAGDKVGFLEAFYSQSIEAEKGECPFLAEEKTLLKLVAERLGRIIERKKAEEFLEEAKNKFSSLVDNVPGVIYRCANDLKWTMNYISDEIKTISGYPASDFIGNKIRTYESIIYEKDRDLVHETIQKAIQAKKSYNMEYRIANKDDKVKWVGERGKGVFNKDKELVWLDGVIFDISLQKEAEEKLERAIKIKSDFLSTVSHELRTPLAAIKEGINIVYDQSAGDINKEQKEFLNISKRNVDRLARLINDVLDIQKLESGKMEFNFKENDINSIIEEVFETMKPHAAKKELKFKLDLDKNIPKIEVDRDKLIQVITNLVSNAIKFTEQGSIIISSLLEKNIVKVWVEDTGPGIKKEDIPKLFKTFQQLQAGKGRKTGGTGLGLAICKDIIGKHRGKIWVESESGKGSKFIFLLPIEERRA